jgi:hypothetical protein
MNWLVFITVTEVFTARYGLFYIHFRFVSIVTILIVLTTKQSYSCTVIEKVAVVLHGQPIRTLCLSSLLQECPPPLPFNGKEGTIQWRKHIPVLQRYAKRCGDVSSWVMMGHEREADKAHIAVQFYTAKLWTKRKPRQLSQSRECDRTMTRDLISQTRNKATVDAQSIYSHSHKRLKRYCYWFLYTLCTSR